VIKLLISSMSLVMLAWFLFFLIFVGFGIFIRRSFGLKINNMEKLLTSFWMGWAFVIFFLQLWHFYFRVDWRVFIIVSIISVVGIFWNYKDIYRVIKNLPKEKCFYFTLFLLFLTILWLANRAILPVLSGDSRGYHLSSIHWATSFPIIPGLGNLHGRLAFNSSYFLYVALLEIGPWINRSHHLCNSLLFVVLISYMFLSAYKLLKNNNKLQFQYIFCVLLLAPILVQVLGANFTSPSPDVPIFIIEIIISIQFLIFLKNRNLSSKETRYNIFFIVTISILGVTIKLSFLMFALTILLLIIINLFIKGYNQNRFNDVKSFMWISFSIVLVALLPWMVSNVILSGYIAYPSTFGAFPVEWRIPRASVINNANWVYSWARTPCVHWTKVLGNWDWLKPWVIRIFHNNKFDVLFPISVTFICYFVMFFYRSIKYHGQNLPKNIWQFSFPAFASLVFLFFTAPTVRFAGACFWILAAGAIMFMAKYFNKIRIVAILYIILLLCVIFSGGLFSVNGRWIVLPQKNNNGFYENQSESLEEFTTNSGLTIYVALNGHCDENILCSLYTHPNLRLRQKGNIRYGFMVYPRDEQDPAVGMHYSWPPP